MSPSASPPHHHLYESLEHVSERRYEIWTSFSSNTSDPSPKSKLACAAMRLRCVSIALSDFLSCLIGEEGK